MTINVFAGLRVLDFTTAWAGPFVGRFLGGLGADVVKVESARNMDIWRAPFGQIGSYNQAPNFNSLNRNKRSIALEASTEAGRETFLRLVEVADIVVANFTARVLPNLHLEYDNLRARNPRIILLNMPALGASGPYSALAGYGTVIEAFGGMADRFGYRHEDARVSQTFYPDGVAGVHAVVALQSALRRRDATGTGCHLDLSQQETLLLQFADGIATHSLRGHGPARLGNAEPRCAPSGIYPAASERWIAIVARTEEQWQALANLAGDRLDPFREMGLEQRLARRNDLDDAVAAWTQSIELRRLTELLTESAVAAAPVNTYLQAQRSTALARLEILEEIDHPEMGASLCLRSPVRFEGRPSVSRSRAPLFGEHTDEVLREWLEIDDAEIHALRSTGALGEAPTT